jgi:hypothetical protein
MKNLKHTKGPWKTWGNGDLYVSVTADKANAKNICIFALSNIEIDIEEYNANASLIAAAPEMLEMLIFLYENAVTDITDDSFVSKLENLIEKATGMKFDEVIG